MLTSKFPKYDEFFSDDIFDLLQKISRGYSVDVNDNQAHKLTMVAMLIGNDELAEKTLALNCMDNLDTRDVQSYIEYAMSINQVFEYLKINPNEITGTLWKNLCRRFYVDKNKFKT